MDLSNSLSVLRNTLLLSCACVALGHAAQPKSATQLHEAAPSPLLDCNGLPCVMVTVGRSKPIRLAIDTGNANSFIDEDLAHALRLKPEPILGGDGKAVAGVAKAHAKSVAIGGVVLDDLTVVLGELKSEKMKGLIPDVDGILAYTAFKDRVLTLDFRNNSISVSAAGAGRGADGKPMTHPTFGAKGPPIVATEGFEIGGKPIVVQVDTLYAGSLLIYPTSVDKLGLTKLAGSAQRRHFPFTDGGVDMLEAQGVPETFDGKELLKNAPLYFVTPGVHLPDGLFDGTVGVALMKGHVVTFDFHANSFSIQ